MGLIGGCYWVFGWCRFGYCGCLGSLGWFVLCFGGGFEFVDWCVGVGLVLGGLVLVFV